MLITNSAGVAGYKPFLWSASTGTTRLASAFGTGIDLLADINDDGLIVGASQQPLDAGISAVVWGASLDLSPGPVTVTKKKTIVSVLVTNPFSVMVTDAVVISYTVTKDEVSVDVLLKKPLKIGSIDPGGTAILQLGLSPDITAPFTIRLQGSSSAGGFDETVTWALGSAP